MYLSPWAIIGKYSMRKNSCAHSLTRRLTVCLTTSLEGEKNRIFVKIDHIALKYYYCPAFAQCMHYGGCITVYYIDCLSTLLKCFRRFLSLLGSMLMCNLPERIFIVFPSIHPAWYETKHEKISMKIYTDILGEIIFIENRRRRRFTHSPLLGK